MAIFMDDEPAALGGDTLRAVFDAGRAQVAAGGDDRMVIEVWLDGQSLTAQELTARAEEPVAGHEVRLFTASAMDLAAEALRQLQQELSSARALLVQAGEFLQQDKAQAAMQNLGRAVSSWQHTPATLQLAAQAIGVAPDTPIAGDDSIAALIEQLRQRLESVRDQLQAKDTVALADALAYEWPETSDRWDAIIAGLLQRIG